MAKFYETIFILRPTMNDQEITELIENYQSVLVREGAEILFRQDMGKKKLAYPLRHFQNGHYVIYRYQVAPAAVKELERSMKINEDVLRYLTVNLNEKEVAAAAAAVAAAAAAAAMLAAEAPVPVEG